MAKQAKSRMKMLEKLQSEPCEVDFDDPYLRQYIFRILTSGSTGELCMIGWTSRVADLSLHRASL